DSGDYSISITCEDMPEPPVDCEDFVVESNLEGGASWGGMFEQRLAADIPVGEEGFTITGIAPNVIGQATEFNFIFYEDTDGLPGAEWTTRAGTILEEIPLGNHNGYDFYTYRVEFDEPLTFEPNTTYWFEIETDATHWEVVSKPFTHMGNPDAVQNALLPGIWRSTNGLAECVFELICADEMGIGDLNSFDFTYYPNPVKDILNIST